MASDDYIVKHTMVSYIMFANLYLSYKNTMMTIYVPRFLKRLIDGKSSES